MITLPVSIFIVDLAIALVVGIVIGAVLEARIHDDNNAHVQYMTEDMASATGAVINEIRSTITNYARSIHGEAGGAITDEVLLAQENTCYEILRYLDTVLKDGLDFEIKFDFDGNTQMDVKRLMLALGNCPLDAPVYVQGVELQKATACYNIGNDMAMITLSGSAAD